MFPSTQMLTKRNRIKDEVTFVPQSNAIFGRQIQSHTSVCSFVCRPNLTLACDPCF